MLAIGLGSVCGAQSALAQPLGLGSDFAVEFMKFGIFRLKDAVPPFLKPYEPGIELAHPAAVEPGRRP